MCQAAPGPRCWADTSKAHKKLQTRLEKAQSDLDAVRKKMNAAASAGSYGDFEKLRNEEESMVVKVNNLRTAFVHNQRDMDGTKTGLRMLEEQISTADSDIERKGLEDRLKQAAAMRVLRDHAPQRMADAPLLRIAA